MRMAARKTCQENKKWEGCSTEEQPGYLDRINRMDQDLQDLECWNAGIMECWDPNPVNPVCDFGCSSVALCGPLWFMPLISVWGFA